MKFIKSQKEEEDFPLIRRLMKTLNVPSEPHGHDVLHSSDLTHSERTFCPRERALQIMLKKKGKLTYPGTALNATFDVGRAVQDLVNRKWLRPYLYGDWSCRSCGAKVALSLMPDEICPVCTSRAHWRYEEVRVSDKKTGISGGIDGLVDLGGDKLTLIEVKIASPDIFKSLLAPLAEHTLRTRMYLWLTAQTEYAASVDTQVGRVLYISRSHGFKHEGVGSVLPFKEFAVSRDDVVLEPYLALARCVEHFKSTGEIPAGICPSSMVGRASKCSVVSECFSGQFPRLVTWRDHNGQPVHDGLKVVE